LGFGVTFLAFAAIAHMGRLHIIKGAPLFGALLIVRLVGGAYSSATLPTAQAYVADVTDAENRTKGMAVVGMAFALGMVLGPAIGAALASVGLLVPIYFSAVVAMVNGLFVATKLPESPRIRVAVRPSSAGHVVSKTWGVLAASFGVTLASVSMEQTVSFYFQDRLALDGVHVARVVGLGLVLCGLGAAVVQGAIVRRLRVQPLTLVVFGVPFAALGLLCLVSAQGKPGLLAGMALQGVGQGLSMPGLTSALSLSVDKDEQGSAAGLGSASQAMARMLGPLAGTALYEIHPTYPYLFGIAILLAVLGALMTFRAARHAARETRPS
jgi:MFS family permease